MGMDAEIYKVYTKNLTDVVSQAEIKSGWTSTYLPSLPDSELVLLLDLYGENLQEWAVKNVNMGGYITLFMTPDLAEEIKSLFDYDIQFECWNKRVEPLMNQEDVTLVVAFN